ncbi:winged helix-turn-helix transcriptional regulator [Actinoplanes sp. RD1]|uniref:winged helix-turn-helix transcriptional regulator n=1 Tax=Actinoplanes sp. RD1 TaxID=3064538 RepID=UPI002740D5C0|nr:winged helix-turn-helix transcriptional regulator [Actinoplanes sp. RD1]
MRLQLAVQDVPDRPRPDRGHPPAPRRVEPSVPPRVCYALTPLGRSLDEPLAALREWAERHMPEIRDFREPAPPAGGR